MQQLEQQSAADSTVAATAAAAAAAQRADAALGLLSALLFCILPAATTFGASAGAGVWRPSPSNNAYDAMLIVVCASVPATDAALRWQRRRRQQQQQQQQTQQEEEAGQQLQHHRPSPDALKKARGPPRPAGVFELFSPCLALVLGIGYAAAGAPATAAVWLLAAAALAGLLWRASRPAAAGLDRRCSQALAWHLLPQPWARRSRASVGFSAVLALVAAGFIAGPVAAPWDGPVEPFVRWHPFSINAERVWRGVFAAYAAGMLLAALLGPLARPHRPFAVFLAVSGGVHSCTMLVMSVVAISVGGPNGNAEHLYGDVLAWAAVAGCAGVFLRLSRGYDDDG